MMYRSLTHDEQLATLRTSLAAQQAIRRAADTELAAATDALRTAQSALTTATTANTQAQAQLTAARAALSTAQRTLRTVSHRKPRNAAALTRARNAVTTATQTVATRNSEAAKGVAALTTAHAAVTAATSRTSQASTAVTDGTAGLNRAENAITALPSAATLAAQAAAISRDVVTQIRAGFAITDTTQVYGVTVNKTIAFAFQHMIDDAKADGVQMSGGGFRTTQRQAELRTINGCPDVWTAPPSSCRVPTAIPGRSLHEIGLAVDISSGGKTITKKTPAYTWLTRHAKQYGFVNLPAEAWHWSITGN
ncbi:D-alanyl-D-alanine carboxypeptidase [Actinoplanes sp. SE50]|nr:D-alanyl-D-alanine carboxypeptidase [Actinoplanes sp. SE50/110]ATO79578.1 D-alanyl-D-alanine carboxypeptidase [Actinoplanes sp. SE50]SLL96979.1 D-alanyl-D-alanine carboxypeptidase [Actinoplanes sp. SE50/110]